MKKSSWVFETLDITNIVYKTNFLEASSHVKLPMQTQGDRVFQKHFKKS